jgi:hypothetical protein
MREMAVCVLGTLDAQLRIIFYYCFSGKTGGDRNTELLAQASTILRSK